jgi:hypothetical protein
LHFFFRYGRWSVAETHYANHARHGKHRETIIRIKAAKYVTRKKRLVRSFFAIRPLTLDFVGRGKLLEASLLEVK